MADQTQEGLDNKSYENKLGNTIDDGSNYINNSPVNPLLAYNCFP